MSNLGMELAGLERLEIKGGRLSEVVLEDLLETGDLAL
jgi:hypothetical protein